MLPIIGVVSRPEVLNSGNKIYYINQEINDAVVKNGGITITINPNILQKYQRLNIEQFEEIKKIINLCDGIISQGGDEILDYDLEIIDYCYKTNKPLLGICQGMQTISYLFGGNIKKLNNLSHYTLDKYVHKVNIKKNSKLYEIINKQIINVNSRHKYYVTNTNLDVVAYSDDNIIEAIEDKNKKFFIGVEWHPESMIEYDILENKLFSYFIECCRR